MGNAPWGEHQADCGTGLAFAYAPCLYSRPRPAGRVRTLGWHVNISNRSIVVLAVVTLLLVVGAGILTLMPAAPPPQAVSQLSSRPMDFHFKPSVVRRGGRKVETEGPLVVNVERTADYETAMLVCDMYISERPFTEGTVVFPTIPFGECSLRLVGTEVPYAPVYPGDTLACVGIDGQTQCTGGVAARRAAQVSVRSELPGTLELDGDPFGALPLENLRMKVGERHIAVKLDDGRTLRWKLVVKPEEMIDVYFASPDVAVADVDAPAPTAAP
jgi:hypothetical protein